MRKYAVIIRTTDRELQKDEQRFEKHLAGCDFKPDHIIHIPPKSAEDSLDMLECVQAMKDVMDPTGSIVYFYAGHGCKGAISPNRKYEITYKDIARRVPTQGPIIMITSTCYAGSAVQEFARRRLFSRTLLLASSGNGQYSYGVDFVQDLTDTLAKRKEFCPKKREWDRVKVKTEIIREYLYGPQNGELSARYKTLQIPIRKGANLDHILYPQRKH